MIRRVRRSCCGRRRTRGHAAAATQLGHLYSGKYAAEPNAGRRTEVVPERQPRRGTSRLNSPSVRSIWRAAVLKKISKRRCHGSRERRKTIMHHRNFSSRSCIAPGRACRRIWSGRSFGTSSRLSLVIGLAQFNLAVMLSKGQGCEQDQAKAFLVSKGRRAGLAGGADCAWRRLSRGPRCGTGGGRGRRWYEAAARQRNEVAAARLKQLAGQSAGHAALPAT